MGGALLADFFLLEKWERQRKAPLSLFFPPADSQTICPIPLLPPPPQSPRRTNGERQGSSMEGEITKICRKCNAKSDLKVLFGDFPTLLPWVAGNSTAAGGVFLFDDGGVYNSIIHSGGGKAKTVLFFPS